MHIYKTNTEHGYIIVAFVFSAFLVVFFLSVLMSSRNTTNRRPTIRHRKAWDFGAVGYVLGRMKLEA